MNTVISSPKDKQNPEPIKHHMQHNRQQLPPPPPTPITSPHHQSTTNKTIEKPRNEHTILNGAGIHRVYRTKMSQHETQTHSNTIHLCFFQCNKLWWANTYSIYIYINVYWCTINQTKKNNSRILIPLKSDTSSRLQYLSRTPRQQQVLRYNHILWCSMWTIL